MDNLKRCCIPARLIRRSWGLCGNARSRFFRKLVKWWPLGATKWHCRAISVLDMWNAWGLVLLVQTAVCSSACSLPKGTCRTRNVLCCNAAVSWDRHGIHTTFLMKKYKMLCHKKAHPHKMASAVLSCTSVAKPSYGSSLYWGEACWCWKCWAPLCLHWYSVTLSDFGNARPLPPIDKKVHVRKVHPLVYLRPKNPVATFSTDTAL